MGMLVEIGKVGELENGTMKILSVQGHDVLLARVEDKYYATNERCPHMGGKLSRGKLEGTVVTCPNHGSQFDLTTGQVVRWLKGAGLLSKIGKALKSARPLTIYQVTVEADKIQIEI